ncbi:F-box protein CPR1-like [Rhododendron vialii]|uniref:F-box protein CPR1-like n=1 Tax=Rhododendron vialii TaxID=182163 RepID=UPI0026605716|nr:F-box protein CPR1-like [Rhododendron vialii]XP_058219395.1 F-box protein CPR1-like [Rhododendron vialii]
MTDYIPQDVLVNIFIRLTIKTLLQCTSVCKSWYSIIVNPSFIDSHLNRPPTQTYNNAHHLLLVRTCSSDDDGGKELYSLHCDDESFDEYAKLHFPFSKAFNMFFRIVGSCNGVLCLTDDQMSYVHNTIMWNPEPLNSEVGEIAEAYGYLHFTRSV